MSFKRVSASEALELQRVGFLLIDVRPPEDFKRGHPASARNIPFYFYTAMGHIRPNPDFVSTVQSLYPVSSKLLLIDKVGKRSPDAVVALSKAGFTEVCDLRAGYKGILDATGRHAESGWETLGLPGTMTDDASYETAIEQVKAAFKKR